MGMKSNRIRLVFNRVIMFLVKLETLYAVLFLSALLSYTVFRVAKYEILKRDSPGVLFEKWEGEAQRDLVPVKYGCVVAINGPYDNGLQIRTEEIQAQESVFVQEVFCIANNRAYFLGESHCEGMCKWNICSVSLDGEDYKCHCSLSDFGIPSDGINTYQSMTRIPATYYSPSVETHLIGFYKQGCFYVEDPVSGKKVVYSVDLDSLEEIVEMPRIRYHVNYDGQKRGIESLIVTDETNSATIYIDLDSIAERNGYIKELIETIRVKGYEGIAIRDYAIINDELYIIIEVYDRFGEAYEIVGQYDTEERMFKYVLWTFLSDRVKDYYVVPNKSP